MKECLAKVGASERPRQPQEGMFHCSRHRRKDVLLKQACERTRDEGVFANNTHGLFCLTLCGLYREKCTKKTSGDKLWLLAASLDLDQLAE